MEIPLTGNIRDVSLVKILVALNKNRKTGTLSLSTPAFTKEIYMRDGDAIFASSTYPDDRLGEMLLKADKITVEQYDRSVELLKSTKKRQGAILVELGYLTPKDLFWGVKYQVKEIIHSLFLLEDGTYAFDEAELPTQEVIILKMSMANLIYDGVKKIDNWTRIRAEMPDTGYVMRLSADPLNLFQGIELSVQDRKVLSLIDGKQTIKELMENSWMSSFEALKILYVLWATGMIEQSEPSSSVSTAEESAVEKEAPPPLKEILRPLSEEEEALLGRVDEIFPRLEELSPYELLEISEGTDSDTVKKNYYRLAKEFHPDRNYAIADDSLKMKLTAIFGAVAKAYNAVKNGAPADAAQSPAAARKAAKADETAKAEDQFRRGIDEFKKGNFWGAVESFKWAAKIMPKHAGYWSHLSLAFSKIPGRLKDAEEALLSAVKIEPFNADHYANLGLIYLKAKSPGRAKSNFEKALKIDSGNEKAKKGLSQITK